MDSSGDQLDFNFAADDLLEFPRDLGEEGWFQFHSEQKQAVLALERRFGLAINQRVRLRLAGERGEMEGRLVLDSLLMPAPSDETVRLRLGTAVFENTDVEWWERID